MTEEYIADENIPSCDYYSFIVLNIWVFTVGTVLGLENNGKWNHRSYIQESYCLGESSVINYIIKHVVIVYRQNQNILLAFDYL